MGRVERNRERTGLLAEGEHDNAALWHKISKRDESLAHLVSRRIVQFAHEQGATILVFEVRSVDLKPTTQTRRGMVAQADKPVTT